MRAKAFIDHYSENIGGAVSLGASALLMLGGEPLSIGSAFVFAAAELTLMARGQTRWGYSLAAAGFALGDGVLACAPLAASPQTRFILFAMAGAWAVGACRAPVAAWQGWREGAPLPPPEPLRLDQRVQRAVDVLPNIVAVTVLACRLPGLGAAWPVSKPLFFAILGWGVADVLTGRLHQLANLLRGRARPPGPAAG